MAEAARATAGETALLCPVIDAKWNLLYAALYSPQRSTDFLAEKPEELVKQVPEEAIVFGSGLENFGNLFEPRKSLGPEFAHPRPSFVGLLASTLQGSTETTFYVLTLYAGAAGVRDVRFALIACLSGDLGGLLGATAACHLFFG